MTQTTLKKKTAAAVVGLSLYNDKVKRLSRKVIVRTVDGQHVFCKSVFICSTDGWMCSGGAHVCGLGLLLGHLWPILDLFWGCCCEFGTVLVVSVAELGPFLDP